MAIVHSIDLKHHVDENGKIIKTSNGEPIPDNEPTILFRGRDKLAMPMLLYYRKLCESDGCTDYQLKSMDEMIERFRAFAHGEGARVMKQPGITRGA